MANKSLRWMRLDNAAKIYPAARRQNWSNVFRLSITLKDKVDRQILQDALDATVPRFPSMAARLRKGMFWYYLQELEQAPRLSPEYAYPLARMDRREMGGCALRVIAYENRIAVELFHCLTDGNGGLVFLKTLTAEYLRRKYGVHIPCTHGVLDLSEAPGEEELEDSFLKYAGTVAASRKEENAWKLSGTYEEEFLHLTCLRLSAPQALEKAHAYGVSLTAFLTAAMMQALLRLQAAEVPNRKRRKAIKVLIPVNLRKLFPSRTLRNFVLFVTPGVDPRLGEYTFCELCKSVHHQMGQTINAKHIGRIIAANVADERNPLLKIVPLFIKNIVMKAVFDAVGERKSCLTLSNLGRAELPDEMLAFVTRMDFILSPQAMAPHNCGVICLGDTVYINFIRNIREPMLEAAFYEVLREQGLTVTAESNQ